MDECGKFEYCPSERFSIQFEDSIVLSREELSKALTDNFNTGKKEAQFYSERVAILTTRKETVREILNAVDNESNGQTISITNYLRKKYGVEAEE